MKEYTIKLCEYEIGILEDCLKYALLDQVGCKIVFSDYRRNLLRGILQQILEQK
jgi:hypothetical protein|tara:strand:+ start:958 stop:1119 length:162 start_codon:yes stop_codon:yes gene_type:complete